MSVLGAFQILWWLSSHSFCLYMSLIPNFAPHQWCLVQLSIVAPTCSQELPNSPALVWTSTQAWLIPPVSAQGAHLRLQTNRLALWFIKYGVIFQLATPYTAKSKQRWRDVHLLQEMERSVQYQMKRKLPLSLLLLKIHKYLTCRFTRAILRCYFNTKEGRKPVGNKTSREEGLSSHFHSLFPCSKSINKGL